MAEQHAVQFQGISSPWFWKRLRIAPVSIQKYFVCIYNNVQFICNGYSQVNEKQMSIVSVNCLFESANMTSSTCQHGRELYRMELGGIFMCAGDAE